MRRTALVLFLSAFASVAFAQKKLVTISTPDSIAFACVDRPGDLYVILASGLTRKYDKNGKQIGEMKFASVPTIFDPKDGTRAFAYFRDSQTILSITPDLSESEASPVHPEFAVSAWLICPSKNEFWILDGADVTVKKTKEKGSAIAYETRLSTTTTTRDLNTITFMREYLNFLFVLEGINGVHVLNNLGKEIRTLGDGKIQTFGFLGEEMYYPQESRLQMIDLYNGDQRTLELPHPTRFALLTDDRMILSGQTTIEYYEFKP